MWEYWDDQRSRNHFFLGTVDDWLFEHVAGVHLTAPGYRRVRIEPDHLEHLESASARIDTVRGELAVEWERDGNRGQLRLTLPAGSSAEITLPGASSTAGPGTTVHPFTLENP